jgi:glycine/D-amino acid oxidase-like deaminating enzyme
MSPVDVVIVGAGHNGLVAAIMLARAGLRVRVLESAPVVGGACRTEHPFARAPGVGQSTGAYLLGLMPPELMRELGVSFPLIRRGGSQRGGHGACGPRYFFLRLSTACCARRAASGSLFFVASMYRSKVAIAFSVLRTFS